jgi:hypothetical protein
MQRKGASARTIQYSKGSILNAIFTTALEDEVVMIHPSRGVKIPPVPDKPRHIISAAQFDRLYQALPDAGTQLLVETGIESGLRWGELSELRVRDLDFASCILTVSRAVVEIRRVAAFSSRTTPRIKEYRRFKLSQQITAKLRAHATASGLGPDDPFFSYRPPSQPRPMSRLAGQSLWYSASVTCSPHWVLPSVRDRWVIMWSGAAPCQCHSSALTPTTFPGRIRVTCSPRAWTSPSPSVTCRVWEMEWECQAVRAPGAKCTLPRDSWWGPWPAVIGSIQTSPVNQFSGPRMVGLLG